MLYFFKVILVLTACLTDLVGVFVCLSVTACLTDLCGDSKLGNNLAVGVDSSTKAWPELRWVVLRRLEQKNIFCVFSSSTLVKNWSHENKQRGKMASSLKV